jgi:hypothetical protein
MHSHLIAAKKSRSVIHSTYQHSARRASFQIGKQRNSVRLLSCSFRRHYSPRAEDGSAAQRSGCRISVITLSRQQVEILISFGRRRFGMSISNMQRPARHVPSSEAGLQPIHNVFRKAMRQLAGGVSVITVGEGTARTGLTAISVASLSSEPATSTSGAK